MRAQAFGSMAACMLWRSHLPLNRILGDLGHPSLQPPTTRPRPRRPTRSAVCPWKAKVRSASPATRSSEVPPVTTAIRAGPWPAPAARNAVRETTS